MAFSEDARMLVGDQTDTGSVYSWMNLESIERCVL